MPSFPNLLARGLLAAVTVLAAAPSHAELAPRPWHVAAPAVSHRELRFESHGVTLTGTLSLPASGTGLPAVVVTHAAEAPTRDYALYRHLAEDLPKLGYAVFVYDRRGSGASGGDRETSDYTLLADDAIAAQKAIAQDPRIDPRRIGFWGLSQGGWLSILAAARSPDAAFAVSISAPLTSPADQMVFAVRNMMSLHGYPAADIEQAVATRHTVDGYLRGEVDRAAAQAALDRASGQPWFKDTFLGAQLSPDPSRSRWRLEMSYDPVAPLLKTRVPVLVIYGADDPWVPAQDSLHRLEAIQRSHANLTVRVLPNADHMLMAPAKDAMAFDAASLKAEAPESPAYYLLLGDWLARTTARPAATPVHAQAPRLSERHHAVQASSSR